MRKDEWQSAFGAVPESFENSVAKGLRRLETPKTIRRWSVKAAAIAAAAILALSGTALAVAKHWGSLDYLNRRAQQTLPEATGLVEDLSSVPSVSTQRVKYSAQDMLCDGNMIFVTVMAEPLDPNALLAMVGDSPDTLRLENGDELPLDDKNAKGTSLKELSQSHPLILVDMPGPDLFTIGENASELVPDDIQGSTVLMDGKLYFTLRLRCKTDQPVNMRCTFRDYEVIGCETEPASEPDMPDQSYFVFGDAAQTGFDLKVTPRREVLNQARFDGPIDCEYMTINSIDFETTAVGTYMTMEYTIKDGLTPKQLEATDIISFNMMDDPNSTEFTNGLGGDLTPKDGNRIVERRIFPAMDKLPETIYLRPCYKGGEESTWGATIELKLADSKTK